MLNKLSENRTKTVLCVGRISNDRHLQFQAEAYSREEYLSKVKLILISLVLQGSDTFLFTSWGYFELYLCECLKSMNNELVIGHQELFLMASIRDSDYLETLPDPNDYWRFYYDEEKEGIILSEEERISQLLENANVVLYDSADSDSYVAGFVDVAEKRGMSLVNLNDKWMLW